MIHFDNGIQHECASNTLVVEAANASLPPYESPPPDWHEAAAAAANDEDPDPQDSEQMPSIAPEQGEEEGGPEEDEARGGEDRGEAHMKRLSSLLVILSI